MKKNITRIGTIATMIILLYCAYWLGFTRSELMTEVKAVEAVADVMIDNYIDTRSEEYFNNYIDMRTVIDFEATEHGLQLYTVDGNGYYWER